MSFLGMDVCEVRTLAQQLEHAREEIHAITARLTGALDGAHWVGPDRERFHGDWHGTHIAQLNQVMGGLQQASCDARRNADQQEATSNG